MVRVAPDFSATAFKTKVSNAEQLRVHTILVTGGKAWEAGNLSVCLHHSDPQSAEPKAAITADNPGRLQEPND